MIWYIQRQFWCFDVRLQLISVTFFSDGYCPEAAISVATSVHLAVPRLYFSMIVLSQ